MSQPMQAGINERDGKGGVARPGKLAMSRRARTRTVWTAVKPDMGLRRDSGSAPAARNTHNTISINIIYCISPIIIITVLAKE